MAAFIDKKANYSVKYLETKEEADQFIAKKLSILFYLPKDDSEHNKVFTSICANYETIDCAFVANKDFLGVDLAGSLGLVLNRNFDDGVKALDLS